MMSTAHMICPRCGAACEVETCGSVNTAATPELKGRVLDGSLFVWSCGHCGHRSLVRAPFLYHDPEARLMIWYPSDDVQAEGRVAQMFRSEAGLSGYTARLVDSIGDLVEKVKIFDAGLDDMAMEMCKYVTRMEIGQDTPPMKFVSLSGADHEITLTYPKAGQMEMVAIGFNVYEDCAAIIARNPTLRTGGLVRIDDAWVGSILQ